MLAGVSERKKQTIKQKNKGRKEQRNGQTDTEERNN